MWCRGDERFPPPSPAVAVNTLKAAQLSQNIHRIDLLLGESFGQHCGDNYWFKVIMKHSIRAQEKGSKGMDSEEEKRGLMS